jgi:outer membrane protein assembly factor BamB
MFIIFSVPVMSLAFVTWATVTRKKSDLIRKITMILTIILASGIWVLLRTDGLTGEGRQEIGWRWSKNPEDLLSSDIDMVKQSSLLVDSSHYDGEGWPGFRGTLRDGVIHGLSISTGWKAFPPAQLWKKTVGPGCSSFAIWHNLLYTQEQRGEYELVSCYDLRTGDPVWIHKDKIRFYEPHAGPGPRSTPVVDNGKLFSLGGTGILNVLDASNGSMIWSRDAASDAGIKTPVWGFCGSPLVAGSRVLVPVAGKLIAYDIIDGKLVWSGCDGGPSYSSPQLMSLNGQKQVVFMSDSGSVGINPDTGTVLWEYRWKITGRILQPLLIEPNDLLLCGEYKSVRRVSVVPSDGGFKVKEIWNSTHVRAVFNDFVSCDGYAYGWDGPYLVCIDLADGKLMWRGARYQGFSILLADQKLILILTEKGEVVLVEASPQRFTELGRFRAISGKTWNHPALAGNILVVRNAREMAAFRLGSQLNTN